MRSGFLPDQPGEIRGKMLTRRIRSGDAAAAAELGRLVRERPNDTVDPFPPSVENEVLADMGARGKDSGGQALVACEGELIVGYGALDFSPQLRRALIVGPIVHPAHRRKGHGQALLQELLDQARSVRQRHVRILVGARNGAAEALLRANGFRRKERHTCLRLTRPERLPCIKLGRIAIERVGPESADLYFEFTRKFVPRQPRQTRSLLKADTYTAILAYRDGKPVGCVEVDTRYGPVACVETLEAPPSLLHKGLGNALLSEAIKAAFENPSVTALDLVMAGADRERIEVLVKNGFLVRHELLAYELRL